jgi:hypothetical protein
MKPGAPDHLALNCSEAFLAAKGPGWTVAVAWLDRVRENLESYRGALTWLIELTRRPRAYTHWI